MKKYFENDDILAIAWRWKKQFGIIFICSLLLSIIVSSPFIIKPRYKSFARVYPSNLTSYSEESYSEQMLQLLESDVLRDILVTEFNLQQHYKIEDDDSHKIDNLYKKYNESVTFTKTKFESVEISVVDESADTAYIMLNRLIEVYNQQVKIIQDTQLKEAVSTLEIVLKTKEVEMDSLEKKINFIRDNYGILDYQSQVKSISKEYYKLLGRENSSKEKINKFKKELDLLKVNGSEFERLVSLLKSERAVFSQTKVSYDSQHKELLRNKQYANVIVKGHKSDKKVYPIRSLIVIVSVMSTMLVAFGLISFIDRIDRTAK